MKLDVNQLRYLSREDFRVLQAVELGQKNHELVPVPLVDSIAGLKHGGTVRCLKQLLKSKLVHHENTKYDGYRLTNLGYDYLAIKAMVNRGTIESVGRQIGVGKEADVFEVLNEKGDLLVLKLHRLGRTSFRAVKSKRDYLKHRNSFSWLYLSRLAALKEFAFMVALREHGFPVPVAVDHSRHAVLMSLIDGVPLVQLRELQEPGKVYAQCMDIMARLAAKGLIHCDFNEFNLLIDGDEQLTLIDFPQMVSVGHGNARELFYRDVECVIRFFKKKIGYIPEHDTSLECIRPDFEGLIAKLNDDIGQELKASGFERKHQQTLEEWTSQQPEAPEESEISIDGSEIGSQDCEDNLASASEEEADSRRRKSSEALCQPVSDCLDLTADVNSDLSSGGGFDKTSSSGKEDDQGLNLDPYQGINLDENNRMAADSAGQLIQKLSNSKQIPIETSVQERLLTEMRHAKQAARIKAAAKSAHKIGCNKDRRARTVFDGYSLQKT